ncbi:MAG: YihY/virulence factor BrkB family protein [Candidatus Cyclobacteriaceae bacterium M3_2C_046]
MKKYQRKLKQLVNFFNQDIWRINLSEHTPYKVFYFKTLKVVLIAIKGYQDDKCPLRASALTFYSLLSIVPVLAMAFGIAKGFGFEKGLDSFIRQNLSTQEVVIREVVGFADRMLENTQGGVIAGIGLLVLFWSVLQLLNNIEDSLNAIWQVKQARSMVKKLTDYLTIVLISPIFVFLSTSITAFVATQIQNFADMLPFSDFLAPIVAFIIQLMSYVLIWLLLSFVYLILPNTRVNIPSALIAGILAGTVYQLVQWAYITFQIGVSRYSAIYGTFAALPLFLIWLQLSWLIFLFGAEISFAYQHVGKYKIEKEPVHLSIYQLRLISLLVVNLVIKRFIEEKDPYSMDDMAKDLQIPHHILKVVIDNLIRSKILSETLLNREGEIGYQPATDVNKYSLSFVLNKLEYSGSNGLAGIAHIQMKKFEKLLDEFSKTLQNAPSNILLKDV